MLVHATPLIESVIGAAIEVHRSLGPGLLESAYAQCLALELSDRAIPFRREVTVPFVYKGQRIDHGFRVDFVVNGELLVEIKSAESMLPLHRAQVVTYLRLMDRSILRGS
jgi:GxxExxY protein